jgi:hypothetical protein
VLGLLAVVAAVFLPRLHATPLEIEIRSSCAGA